MENESFFIKIFKKMIKENLYLKCFNVYGNLILRRACVSDVEMILTLINRFAGSNLMLPRGPRYLYENIRDFLVADSQAEEPDIVACGSLHVLWKDVAEIRALAVHPDYQNRGLGSRLVRYLVEDARHIGVESVFAFTMIEEFFMKLGFVPKKKEELPSKVWGECSRCPKHFNCDETGLILKLSGDNREEA